MTFEEAYDAARDFVATTILTVWPDSTVYEGRAMSERTAEDAFFSLNAAGIENETPVSDMVRFEFSILGVWENDRAAAMNLGREGFKSTKASMLHAALSAAGVDDDLYSPQVSLIEFSDFQDDATGDFLAVSMLFNISASIDRA